MGLFGWPGKHGNVGIDRARQIIECVVAVASDFAADKFDRGKQAKPFASLLARVAQRSPPRK